MQCMRCMQCMRRMHWLLWGAPVPRVFKKSPWGGPSRFCTGQKHCRRQPPAAGCCFPQLLLQEI